jgi:hypothetical protein
MLPNLKTMEMNFDSVRSALDYLSGRAVQRFTVPLHDLEIDTAGRVTHKGAAPIADVRGLPVTATALAHLNGLVDIPQSYAAQIEPQLHAHSLNELFQKQVAAVTVVVEIEKKNPDSRYVDAVVPGGRLGVDDALVLERLESRNLSAAVRMRSGQTDIRVGDSTSLQVLSGDDVQLSGALHNERWGTTTVTLRPMLEVSMFLLRCVCTNGAYAQRALAESRLMAWATRKEIEVFLDREIERVLNFPSTVLSDAVAAMSETIPSDEDRERIAALVRRFVGKKRSEEMIKDAVSWWDHFNVATAAANGLASESRRRRLQIAAGEYLNRFLV